MKTIVVSLAWTPIAIGFLIASCTHPLCEAEAANFTSVGTGFGPNWGDLNNDGWTDNIGGQQFLENDSTVLLNNGDGTFSSSILPNMRYVSSRSLGDYNNDGYLDVFGYSSGEYGLSPNTRLMTNLGGTGFQDDSAKYLATSTTPAWVHRASTWVDITGDGYLDNYVTSWNEPWLGPPDDDMIYVARPGADPENGTITFEHTWNSNPDYNGQGVTHFDYDRDGDQDLYVSNYWLTPNQLLVNNGFNGDNGALQNVNGEGGSATHSVGSSLGDFNNDGDIDVFISTFSHSYNPPSRFLRNNGASSNFSFTSVGTSGIQWVEPIGGSMVADYDNDGDLDVLVTTVAGYGGSNQPKLYENTTAPGSDTFSFQDVGLMGLPAAPYKAAWADYDNDGFLDVVAAGQTTNGQLFKNPGTTNWPSNHYLKVHLTGGQGDNGLVNGAAIGAQAWIDVPGLGRITRQVEGSTGGGAQNDLTLHFGLGTHSGPVDVTVFWPDGTTQDVTNVSVNQQIEISLGGQVVQPPGCDLNADSACDLADLNQMYADTGYDLVNGVSSSGVIGPGQDPFSPVSYTMTKLGPDMTTNVHAIALDAAGTGLLVGEGGNSASIELKSLDPATGTLSTYLDLWTSSDFAEVTIRDIDVDPDSGDLAVLLWRNEGAQSAKWLQIYDSSLNLENTWDVSGRNGVVWGPDGKIYVAGEGGDNLYEVDPDTGAEISHTVGANLLGIAVDSNGKLLLPQYGKINIFDPDTDTVSMWINGRDETGAPENWYAPNLMTPGGEIEDIAIGPDGRVIANQRNHGKLHVFKPDGSGPVIQMEDLSGEFTNNNERKMVADAAGNLYLIHNGNNALTGNNAGVYKFSLPAVETLEKYDLNDDGVVDNLDIDEWLASIAIGDGYDSPYLRGDTDLDRDIDLTDFSGLAANFDPSGISGPYLWAHGNFDGDSDVDLSDYNSLASNFSAVSYGTVAVPEPAAALLALLALLLASARGRLLNSG